MSDVVFLAGSLLFFAVSAVYLRGCDSLKDGGRNG